MVLPDNNKYMIDYRCTHIYAYASMCVHSIPDQKDCQLNIQGIFYRRVKETTLPAERREWKMLLFFHDQSGIRTGIRRCRSELRCCRSCCGSKLSFTRQLQPFLDAVGC